MTKTQAAKLFKSQAALGRALGITRAAVGLWPEQLPQYTHDRVIGAALRLGLEIPPQLMGIVTPRKPKTKPAPTFNSETPGIP